jgi:hypothetical protein
MTDEYALAVEFTDQSLNFAYGFEAGQIFESLKRGKTYDQHAVREENVELLHSICRYLKRRAVFDPSNVEGWIYFSDRPFLELVVDH